MRSLLIACVLCALSAQAPKDRFAWNVEGQKLYQSKDFAGSAAAFRMAIKTGDHTSLTQYNLACSLALAGKPDDAFTALDAAIRAGYNSADHLGSDSDLDSLHGDRRWAAVMEAARKNQMATEARMQDPRQARIDTSDLKRFWRAYAEAQKVEPAQRAAVYSKMYFRDAGSPLTFFLARANMKPDTFAKMIEVRKDYFAYESKHQNEFQKQADLLRLMFLRFKALYPPARFPDTVVMLGGFNSGGTTSDDGLLIGAEMFGRTPDVPTRELGDWEKRVLMQPDEFVPLAVHECAHYQQRRMDHSSLLTQCLHEGAADFVSFLVTNSMLVRTKELHFWGNAHEREVWGDFQKEKDLASNKGWLYGNPKPGWPDDVGYWIGYKICESYYGRAEDKSKALADILTMTDAKAFLEASRYADKFGN